MPFFYGILPWNLQLSIEIFIMATILMCYKHYVNLWWPNGYGSQHLYVLEFSFINQNVTEKSVKRIKIGFRNIELIQDELEDGRSFYFKINGLPLFMKGANTIPISILPEKGQNPDDIRFLLQSAKDVHMNMLRVWGGGVYESDYFYEIADELGLLIWQDFMFACSMYPANDNYLRSVRLEVQHQVRRLQHHPSIALWAGNNENEAALRFNWYGTSENFTLYKNDYKKLYIDVIKTELQLNDKWRSFLTSSPTNGIESDAEGYVASNPYSTLYGDVHYYFYWLDSWNPILYVTPRFASEYGYQSFPSVKTLLSATNKVEDLLPNSSFLVHRQHHPDGLRQIENLIKVELQLPECINKYYYEALIFYSQIIQAVAVKIQTEHYRSCRSNIISGRGLTMGAMYWQLNDVWVAPTWSSIDFKKKWKMLHYYAQNFFAPILITGLIQYGRQLKVFVVSDLLEPVYNASVGINVYRWDSFLPLKNENILADILPGTSLQITSFWIDKYLSEAACGDFNFARNYCFIYLTLNSENNDSIAPDNFVLPTALRNTVGMQYPEMKVSVIEKVNKEATEFKLEIAISKIALFVWLDSINIDGRFSENGFIQVNKRKTVYFYSKNATTIQNVLKSITISNLKDKRYL